MKLSVFCTGVTALLITALTLPRMVTAVAVPFGMQAGVRRTFYDVGPEAREEHHGSVAAREELIEIRDPMPASVASSETKHEGRDVVTLAEDDLDTHTGATIDKRKKKKKVKVTKVKVNAGEKNVAVAPWLIVGSVLLALIPMAL